MTAAIALAVSVFLACAVEAVEAATLVLAAGTARDWRSALLGTGAAVVVLAVATAIAGPAIELLPIAWLRLGVGVLLLVFGLQWLRKAVLRAARIQAPHDEERIYARAVDAAESAGRTARMGVRDWYAFVLAFKAVLLEGLEVVFIVVTFGASSHGLGIAAIAAGAAVIVVVLIAIALRAPLARVPENALKFVVGALLTGFGTFWASQGAGAGWPGEDWALLGIIPGVALVAAALVFALRARRPAPAVAKATGRAIGQQRSPLARFGLFWYDYLVGDDWTVALAAVLAVAATALLAAVTPWAWAVMALATAALMVYGTIRAARRIPAVLPTAAA